MISETIMKRLIAVIIVFLLSPAVAANAAITKGPYLQNVTGRTIVVAWESDHPTVGNIEYGTGDRHRFYLEESRPNTIHKITLMGLKPATQYHYIIHSDKDVSKDHTFTTAPADARLFTFSVYGDTRDNPATVALMSSAIRKDNPDFVVIAGDFVFNGDDYSKWGTDFFHPAKKLLADTPMFPVMGNHERHSHYFFDFFSIPSHAPNEAWYSFDYGNAHFVIVDTNDDFSPGSPQINWLVDDLSKAHSEWLFVVQHHPPFTTSGWEKDKMIEIRKYLVPVFEKYHVDIVFCGHVHAYERGEKNGVKYVTVGGGGAPLHDVNKVKDLNEEIEKKTYNFSIISVDGDNLTFSDYDDSNSLIDSFSIHKTTHVHHVSIRQWRIEMLLDVMERA